MAQGRTKRDAIAGGVRGDGFFGLGADAALRDVENAAGGDRVVGVGDDLQVGQRVLDFAALVEAGAADDAIRDALAHEEFFERAGLGVRAVEDRDVAPVGAGLGQAINLADDEAGLVVLGVRGIQGDERAVARGRPQVFCAAPRVAGDDGVRGRQDVLRRAVVLLEQDGARAREVALELFDVADRGPAEGVDRLVRVTHDRQLGGFHAVGAITYEGSHEDVLGVVRVLVLVNQDVTEAPVIVLGDQRIVAQQFNRTHDEVVEIQRVRGAHTLVVLDVGCRDDARHRVLACQVRVARRADQLVLRVRDTRRHHLRGEALNVDVLCLEDHLDEALRVLRVVDRERRGQARRLVLVAQQAHARRVEGRHPHAPRVVPHEGTRPFAHLGGCLVRERDREDLPRPRPARGQQVGDAVRENARLAGTRARQDQQRRSRVSDSLALAVVQAAREGIGIHAGALGLVPGGLERGLGRLPRGRLPRLAAGHSALGPVIVVGSQGVLHVEGGHLRRHVVVLESPIGADQETKVRQRSRITHRLQA